MAGRGRASATVDVARRRLASLGISGPKRRRAADVVDWLVAVQAQDFAGAKWALGLRLRRATDSQVEGDFNEGAILRTHVLRPTWHFVRPADIRWLLALTAPRVHAANHPTYRRLGLDGAVFRRSHKAMSRVLEGGNTLTRDELRVELQRAGVPTESGQRVAYLLMQAELEAVICSGPRRGRQFTYALLDERVPHARSMARDAALAELSRRYFVSRGPASVQDFAKWSGLTVAEASQGLESIRGKLRQEDIDGRPYWGSPARRPPADPTPMAYLLSIYDEFLSSYKDRRAMVRQEDAARLVGMGAALTAVIALGGQIVGTWKRRLDRDSVAVEATLFRRLRRSEVDAVNRAAEAYGAFHGLPATLELRGA